MINIIIPQKYHKMKKQGYIDITRSKEIKVNTIAFYFYIITKSIKKDSKF